MSRWKTGLVICLCLALVACAVSEISVALNVAAMAVNVASTAIGGISGIPPATLADITAGLSAADTALTTAAKDLNSGSITPSQIAAITSALANSLLQLKSVSGALPSAAKIAIEAVVAGVDAFLELWQGQQTAAAQAKVSGSYKVHLTWKDRRNVSESLKLLAQAQTNLASIKR